MDRYDGLVLGSGMAGPPIALRAARHGQTVFVEKEELGGTYLNRGRTPTKTMIAWRPWLARCAGPRSSARTSTLAARFASQTVRQCALDTSSLPGGTPAGNCRNRVQPTER